MGLNFRDILTSYGMIESNDLGWEGSGIVTRTGQGAQELRPGDRVCFLSPCSLATRVLVPAVACVQMPRRLSFQDASTMPTAYVTAIISLLEVGRLQPGQSVLIHSASGASGIAAIQVCQMVGAVVYATVGNEEKSHFLTKNTTSLQAIYLIRTVLLFNEI